MLAAGSPSAHSYSQDTREVQDTSADQENKPSHPAKLGNTNIVTAWGVTEGLTEELDRIVQL